MFLAPIDISHNKINHSAKGTDTPNYQSVAGRPTNERRHVTPRRRMNDDANEMMAMLAAVEMGEDPSNTSGASKAKKKKKKKKKSDDGNIFLHLFLLR